MPQYWMISDRDIKGRDLGGVLAPSRPGVRDGPAPDQLGSWQEVGSDAFQHRTVLTTSGLAP